MRQCQAQQDHAPSHHADHVLDAHSNSNVSCHPLRQTEPGVRERLQNRGDRTPRRPPLNLPEGQGGDQSRTSLSERGRHTEPEPSAHGETSGKAGSPEYGDVVKASDIRDLAERQPFRPFAVRLSNGVSYSFREPRQFGAPRDYRIIAARPAGSAGAASAA